MRAPKRGIKKLPVALDEGPIRRAVRVRFAELENRLTSRLLRWMFVFWTGTTITLLGAMFAMLKL